MCNPPVRKTLMQQILSELISIRHATEKNADTNARNLAFFERIITGRDTIAVRSSEIPIGEFLPNTDPEGDYAIRYVNVYKNGNVGGQLFPTRRAAERSAITTNHGNGPWSHTEMVTINKKRS